MSLRQLATAGVKGLDQKEKAMSPFLSPSSLTTVETACYRELFIPHSDTLHCSPGTGLESLISGFESC